MRRTLLIWHPSLSRTLVGLDERHTHKSFSDQPLARVMRELELPMGDSRVKHLEAMLEVILERDSSGINESIDVLLPAYDEAQSRGLPPGSLWNSSGSGSEVSLDPDHSNQTPDRSKLPLDIATRIGNMKVTRLLLAHGAKSAIPDLLSHTLRGLLEGAGSREEYLKDLAVSLIRFGADVNPTLNHMNVASRTQASPMMMALSLEKYGLDICEALLSHGANPNQESPVVPMEPHWGFECQYGVYEGDALPPLRRASTSNPTKKNK